MKVYIIVRNPLFNGENNYWMVKAVTEAQADRAIYHARYASYLEAERCCERINQH